MNDLETIHRNNAAAVQRAIPDLRSRGYNVVAEFVGLNFLGTYSFKGEQDGVTAAARAEAKAQEINAELGHRAELFAPTGDSESAADDVNPISLNGGGSGCITDTAPSSSQPAYA